jgi:hypothetical protein
MAAKQKLSDYIGSADGASKAIAVQQSFHRQVSAA